MLKKALKLAGIIGGVFMMLAGFQTEVHAEPSDMEYETDAEYISKINRLLRIQDWDDRAVAIKVKEYATIRKGKDIESKMVGVLPKGAYVEILKYGEEWTLVESEEIKGYIMTEYLVFADEAKEMYNNVHGVIGIVKADDAKVMDHPYSKSNAIAKKAKGTEVEILARIGNWYRVQLNKNTKAYMSVDDIEIVEFTAMTMEEYKKLTAPVETEQKTETTTNKTTNTTTNNSNKVSASKSDLDMLAAIIQCEAEGESYKGKVAVGAVVLNRVRSKKFPNTIEGVIKQKGQFSPVASGKFARVLRKGANAECYRAAKDALNGSNPIGKCLFFNTGYGKGFRLGGHQFY